MQESSFGISKRRRPVFGVQQTTPTVDYIAPSAIISPIVAVAAVRGPIIPGVAGIPVVAPSVYTRIVSTNISTIISGIFYSRIIPAYARIISTTRIISSSSIIHSILSGIGRRSL